MKITKTSEFSGNLNEMELPITEQQYKDWCAMQCESNCQPIQKVFPQLSAEQREFLMTGASLEEQARIFAVLDEPEPPLEEAQDYTPELYDSTKEDDAPEPRVRRSFLGQLSDIEREWEQLHPWQNGHDPQV